MVERNWEEGVEGEVLKPQKSGNVVTLDLIYSFVIDVLEKAMDERLLKQMKLKSISCL